METSPTICSADFKKGTMIIVKDEKGEQVTFGIVLNNDQEEGILNMFCYNRKIKQVGTPDEVGWNPILTHKQMDQYLSNDLFETKVYL